VNREGYIAIYFLDEIANVDRGFGDFGRWQGIDMVILLDF
jgi:hypothetical protein